MRRAARRDGNEAELVKMARTLGAHWVASGPLDGWVWTPKAPGWHPVEIKLPGRAGSKNEYTEKQKRFFWDCAANGSRWWTWRTVDDVLMCLQEKEIWRQLPTQQR